MGDFLDKEARSRLMSTIPSKDTKPELLLRRTMFAQGLRGWRCHPKKVPGKPDIAFVGLRLAVFVDGAFWHGHPDHFTPGKAGAFWDAKIARNRQRDAEVGAQLGAEGWKVLRFWDFEVNKDPAACARKVEREVFARRKARKTR